MKEFRVSSKKNSLNIEYTSAPPPAGLHDTALIKHKNIWRTTGDESNRNCS